MTSGSRPPRHVSDGDDVGDEEDENGDDDGDGDGEGDDGGDEDDKVHVEAVRH